MTRSVKKGFFIESSLKNKIIDYQKNGYKKPIKTWSRRSTITPDFIGLNIEIHNGRKFIILHITENMIGHKLGEFAPTRNFKKHNFHTKKTGNSS